MKFTKQMLMAVTLLLALSACNTPTEKAIDEPDNTQSPDMPPVSTDFSIDIHWSGEPKDAVFVARRPMNGEWTVLTSETFGKYRVNRLEDTTRFELVVVCSGKDWDTSIYHYLATQEELNRAFIECGPEPEETPEPSFEVSGTVNGLVAKEIAEISFGTFETEYDVRADNPTFNVEVEQGEQTALVLRETPEGYDKGIWKRNLDVKADITQSFDFSKEGFDLLKRAVSLDNVEDYSGVFAGPSIDFSLLDYTTEKQFSLPTRDDYLDDGGDEVDVTTSFFIPPETALLDEWLVASYSQRTDSPNFTRATRSVTKVDMPSASLAARLPGPFTAEASLIDEDPYLLPAVTFSQYTQGVDGFFSSFTPQELDSSSWQSVISRGWLEQNNRFEVPDMSRVANWNDAWNLPPTASLIWSPSSFESSLGFQDFLNKVVMAYEGEGIWQANPPFEIATYNSDGELIYDAGEPGPSDDTENEPPDDEEEFPEEGDDG